MGAQQNAQPALQYLDFQAAVGITKHNGGFAATDQLLTCRYDPQHGCCRGK